MTRKYDSTGKRNSCAISFGADGLVVRAADRSKKMDFAEGRRFSRKHNAVGGPVVARIKVGIYQEDADFLKDYCAAHEMTVSEAARFAIEILRSYCQGKPPIL